MEIEAKFVADGELLERLTSAGKVAGWPVAERSRLRLETVYYDTVDRRLAEHDCALRLRRGEPEGTLLSFKRGSGCRRDLPARRVGGSSAGGL